MRRGTPLTWFWFMSALNTQRFATVLTHQLTCLVMQNTTLVWLSINLMWNLSYKVFARKIWKFTGFTLFSQTHTSIDMHSSCRIPLLCDCLSIWCESELQSVYRFDKCGFYFFSPEIILIKLLTHPSTCYSHAAYHYCVTVYRSDVQCEKQSDYNFDTYGFFNFSPEFIRVHQIQYYRTENTAVQNDVSACLI